MNQNSEEERIERLVCDMLAVIDKTRPTVVEMVSAMTLAAATALAFAIQNAGIQQDTDAVECLLEQFTRQVVRETYNMLEVRTKKSGDC